MNEYEAVKVLQSIHENGCPRRWQWPCREACRCGDIIAARHEAIERIRKQRCADE